MMLLRGNLADLMMKINPKLYQKLRNQDRQWQVGVEPILYVQLGLLRSLLYCTIASFEMSWRVHDPCVANKDQGDPGGTDEHVMAR